MRPANASQQAADQFIHRLAGRDIARERAERVLGKKPGDKLPQDKLIDKLQQKR